MKQKGNFPAAVSDAGAFILSFCLTHGTLLKARFFHLLPFSLKQHLLFHLTHYVLRFFLVSLFGVNPAPRGEFEVKQMLYAFCTKYLCALEQTGGLLGTLILCLQLKARDRHCVECHGNTHVFEMGQK